MPPIFAVHLLLTKVGDQRRSHVQNDDTDPIQIGQIQRGTVDRDHVAEALQRTRELEVNIAIYTCPRIARLESGVRCGTPYA